MLTKSRLCCVVYTALIISGVLAACGGGDHSTTTPPNNPVPTITSLSPNSGVAGSAAFTLIVTGTNFLSSSMVQWNGSARPTTFASSTQVQAQIDAAGHCGRWVGQRHSVQSIAGWRYLRRCDVHGLICRNNSDDFCGGWWRNSKRQ